MNLSFLHAELLVLGALAAAIPIVIHLLLKPKPKQFIFPAMRLIRERKNRTVRRLQLQHLLLLALRVALLSMLGCALARPTLRSSLFSIDQQAPVAVALVFDNSLSMEYKHRGKTRLEEAQELAVSVLNKLPEGSEVSLLESSSPTATVPLDVPSAIARLKKLAASPVSLPINTTIGFACRGLAKSQKARREIYIFSDLAANSFNLTEAARSEVDQSVQLIDAPVRLYAIDVSVEKPENISLGDLKLSQQVLPANSELGIDVTVDNRGPAADRAVTLTVGDETRDNRPVRLPVDQAVDVALKLPPLPLGLHQGKVSVNAGDSLEFDDVRYFTIEVRPPVNLLVVADDMLDSVNLTNALAPEIHRKQNRAKYTIYGVGGKELTQTDLSTMGVVAILNCGTISTEGWQALGGFVANGGGLFVALGERVDMASYNSPAAAAVLPAKLLREEKPASDLFLSTETYSHPVLGKFKTFESNDMSVHPVKRFYRVEPFAKTSTTVMAFSDKSPALLERSFGDGKAGRCLLLTTAAHYRPPPYASWSELPQGWSYVVLMDQIARYLAGVAEARLNFFVGSQAPVTIDPSLGVAVYAVANPKKQVERYTVEPKDVVLTVPMTKELGNYRVDPADGKAKFVKGFSANVSAGESQLTPTPAEKLRELLGKDRFAIARDPEKLESLVDEGRVGRELFSWIMFLVAAIVCVEGYLANRFYRKPAISESGRVLETSP